MTRQQEKTEAMRKSLERTLAIKTREIDEKTRTVDLSFSSEEPYDRWWGTEILDHSEGCCDLTRLNEIGCLLYNHNRDKVIGQILSASIEDNRGIAKVRFDEDAESDVIFQKVKSGSLKGVSVGYIVENWESVAADKKSLDGRFTGPCDIAKKWMPYEISIVSIPADATVGVGRSQEEQGSSIALYEKQLIINKEPMEEFPR